MSKQGAAPDNAQHTPGPWRPVWTTGAVTGWAIIPDGYNVAPIARVGLQNAIPERREEADARLIAAAPDLLAALRDCMADLEHYASTHGPGPDGRLAKARAAVRAATGEEAER